MLPFSWAAEIRESMEHYFRKSKRFTVWWEKNSAVQADVVVNARFTRLETGTGSGISGMSACVVLTAFCNHDSGIAGESFKVDGYSRPDTARNYLSRPMRFSIEKHFKDALYDALKKLEKALENRYPISSRVKSYRWTPDKTEFVIGIGTNYGLSDRYDYLIWHLRKDGGYTVAAIGRCVPGADFASVSVSRWNLDDADVRALYSQIQKNDRSLLGSLFVTARLKNR